MKRILLVIILIVLLFFIGFQTVAYFGEKNCWESCTQKHCKCDISRFYEQKTYDTNSLAGIDADSDGIRDDVQQYIASTHTNNPILKRGLEKIARIDQQRIIHYLDKDMIYSLTHKKDPIAMCLINKNRDDYSDLIGEYKAYLYNTSERMDVWNKIQSQLSGHISNMKINAFEFERTCVGDYIEN